MKTTFFADDGNTTINKNCECEKNLSSIYEGYKEFCKYSDKMALDWLNDVDDDTPEDSNSQSDEFWIVYDLRNDNVYAVRQSADVKEYGWIDDESDREYFASRVRMDELGLGSLIFADVPSRKGDYRLILGPNVLELLLSDYLPINAISIGNCGSCKEFSERIDRIVDLYNQEIDRVIDTLKEGKTANIVFPLHHAGTNLYTGFRFTKTDNGINREIVAIEGLKTFNDKFYVDKYFDYTPDGEFNSDGCTAIFPSNAFISTFGDSFGLDLFFGPAWNKVTEYDRWVKREPIKIKEDVFNGLQCYRNADEYRSLYEQAIEKYNIYRTEPVDGKEGMLAYSKLEDSLLRFERLVEMTAPEYPILNGEAEILRKRI